MPSSAEVFRRGRGRPIRSTTPRRKGRPNGGPDRGVALSLATALFGQLLLAASGILLARALGVEGRGQLAIIVLVPSVLSQLGTLGIPLAITYYVARDPRGGSRLLRSLAGTIAVQVVALSLLQVAVFWLLVTDDEQIAMFAAIPAMPALIAQQYGLAVLQGQQRFPTFNALRVLPITLLVVALVATFALGATSLVDIVLVWTAANIMAGIPLAAVAIRFAAPRGGSSPTPSRRTAFRYGVSAVLGSSSPAEILRLDQAFIALALSRYTLGLYVVAVAFTNLPRFISQSVGIVAFPRVAASVGAETRRLVRHYLLLVLLIAGAVVAVLEITVAWLIPVLFGAAFAGAVHTAQILLIASLFLAMRRILSDIAQGLGYPIGGTVAEVVNIAIALPLVVVAAPLYGIEGAAIALTLGAIVSLVVLALMVLRRQRVAARERIDGESRVDRPPINAIALGGDGTS